MKFFELNRFNIMGVVVILFYIHEMLILATNKQTYTSKLALFIYMNYILPTKNHIYIECFYYMLCYHKKKLEGNAIGCCYCSLWMAPAKKKLDFFCP